MGQLLHRQFLILVISKSSPAGFLFMELKHAWKCRREDECWVDTWVTGISRSNVSLSLPLCLWLCLLSLPLQEMRNVEHTQQGHRSALSCLYSTAKKQQEKAEPKKCFNKYSSVALDFSTTMAHLSRKRIRCTGFVNLHRQTYRM